LIVGFWLLITVYSLFVELLPCKTAT